MKNISSQMQSFGPVPLAERIKRFRKDRGWNQTQMAEAAGVTQSQVSNWERGDDRPSPSALAAIARHAQDSERSLWLVEAGLSAYVEEEDPTTRDVPVLRDAAAAGSPRAIDGRDVEVTLKLPRRWLPKAGKLVGLHVKGDSMSPVVNDGDLVLLNVTERDPYQLIGHMVAARDDEGGITIKYLRRDSGIFLLVPQHTSERHPIRLLHDHGDWSIIGGVVKIISDPPMPKRK